MILFFYGEDNYRLDQKVRELKEKFISASLGDTNLSVLDGASVSYDELVRQALAFPFLSKKRLVIVKNLLLEAKKEVMDRVVTFLPKVPETTVMVFVEEGVPDKRFALFKKLNQPKQSQLFELLSQDKLPSWIKSEVTKLAGNIESEAVMKLVEYVGNDLWRLSNEIKKLATYSKEIEVRDVEALVQPQIQSNIFELIDAIAAKNIKRANQELYRLLNNGQNELYILSMIAYQYRNLLIVKDLEERLKSRANKWEISKLAKLHPFVAQKSLALNQKYSSNDLKEIYAAIVDFDSRIKTGKIEPRVGLELLIFRLSGKNLLGRDSEQMASFKSVI